MDSKSIQKINEAVYILRNFIEMSSHLLPFLVELKYLKKPSENDLEDKRSIIELYKNYHFDESTSEYLMNSPILKIIHESFDKIVEEKSTKRTSKRYLKMFNEEHDRLRRNWSLIDSN